MTICEQYVENDQYHMVAGTAEQGNVYRPVGDVFTVEGAHIHEGWLVVRDGILVGFYLPAERGYFPLRATAPLQFTNP